MVEKVLDIPAYLNVNDIKRFSKYMNLILQDNILDKLRDLYVDDIKMFHNVLKELQFRGIGFKKEVQNNFLKGISYENHETIKVENNTGRFRHIDFSFFGLGDFINDYQITDDRFFNYIEISGLYQYIPSFKRELFKQTLINLNFNIISNTETVQLSEKIDTNKSKKKIHSYNISDHFSIYEFPHFRKFCSEYFLENLSDLNERTLHLYKEYRNTQQKTYNKVLQKYESLLDFIPEQTDYQSIFKNNFQKSMEAQGRDYLDFLSEYFSEANLLKTKPYLEYVSRYEKIFNSEKDEYEEIPDETYEELLTNLKNHEVYSNIREIPVNKFLDYFEGVNIFDNEDKPISKLTSTKIDQIIIKKITKIIQNNTSISEFWNDFKDSLSSAEKEILELRTKKRTLQEIGKEFSVSRERIRQIEGKINKKFSNDINYRFFNDLIKIYLNKYSFIDSEFLIKNGVDAKDIEELKFLILKNQDYISIDNAKYILKTEKYKSYNEVVEKISDNNIVISRDFLSEQNSSTIPIFEWIILEKGYHNFNNRFIKKNPTIVEMLEYLFREKISGSVEGTEESFEKLREMLKAIFNYNVLSNQRSFFSRVADTKNVILVDSNTFKYDDLSDIDSQFINEIKNSIDTQLENSPYADPREIYKNNLNTMKNNNIISFYHLYSIIKHYLSEDYNIGLKNTLYIYGIDNKKESSENLLNNQLKREQFASYNELREKLNWTDYKMDQVISRLDYIVINSNRQIIDITGIEKEEGYKELITTIEMELVKGYVFTIDLHSILYTKDNLHSLLTKYHLAEVVALSNFIKKKVENIRGSWQFLYRKDKGITGLESVLPEIFNDIISKNEIKSFFLKKGYASSSYYIMLDRIQSLDLFIPFDNNSYRNMKKLPLSENDINKIEQAIEQEFQKKEFLTYYDLMKIINLPDMLTLDLTTYSITYIAEYLGYIIIEAYNGSQYELPIIVKPFSQIIKYDELIYEVIISSYDDIFSTNRLIKFLKRKNLMSENARSIYTKLKESKLFEFDDFDSFDLAKEE